MSTADLIERRYLGIVNQYAGIARSTSDLLPGVCKSLRDRGCTWLRASVTESRELIVEGWYVRPDEEGDLPT